ncbi:MAG TPA: glycosyltransferase, partial [Thermoanaerobaculia bacterium]|nr:glycosyltransferase [Thermoanaerobaculia bacterium]
MPPTAPSSRPSPPPAAVDSRGCLVIMPARNEAESIGPTIQRIREALPGVAILVVSDDSTDRTAEIAESAGATVVRLAHRLGYGGAVQTGFKYAVASGHDY